MEAEAQCSRNFEDDHVPAEMPIRERLSHMSLEELQQLKEKLGTKIFDEAMFGSQNTKKKSVSHMSCNNFNEKEHAGRRVRQNRPLEMSSKVRPRRVLPVVKPKVKPVAIDPRFDSLYGTFDNEEFGKLYSFIDRKKKQEIKMLNNELQLAEDEQKKKQIVFVIKKMENELREKERVKVKKAEDEQRHQAMKKALREGKKPVYYNRTELRTIELVKKFETMKQNDRVLKSIAKQRQKNASKSRKKVDVKGLGSV